MNRRSLIVLAGLAVALAALLVLMRLDFGGGQDPGGLHAPGLAERIEDLESLRVVHAENAVLATLERGEGGWMVAEKGGHPANFERLRSVLESLTQARRVEKKTALPEFYSRLGVDEPSSPDATGYLLELDYGDKHPPDGFIVGQRAGAGMAYIRTAGDPQSWMVSADFDLSDRSRDWLDREVIDLASAEVQRVLLEQSGGDALEIARESRDDINFTPVGIPEGRELSYGSVANSIAGALANVEANDVRPASEVGELPRAVQASYETFDGLRLSLDVREEAAVAVEEGEDGEDDPRYWVLFSAAALEPLAVDGPAAPAADEGVEPGIGPGIESDVGPREEPAPGEQAPDEQASGVGERAAELDAKLSGWAYELPEYKSDQWFKTMGDLLKEE